MDRSIGWNCLAVEDTARETWSLSYRCSYVWKQGLESNRQDGRLELGGKSWKLPLRKLRSERGTLHGELWNLEAESRREGDDFLKDSGEEMPIL